MQTVSFHQGNLIPELVEAQAKVFEHFKIDHKQVLTDLGHAAAIDKYLNETDWNTVAIFDIDCIPLVDNIKSWIKFYLRHGNTVFGSPQRSSHITGSRTFVAPSFICFDRDTWEQNKRTSFSEVKDWGDVGEIFSRKAELNGINLEVLKVLKCDKPMWTLSDGTKFGYGTTFGITRSEIVYHAFESNAKHHSSSKFIQKCNEVISRS